MVAEIGEGLDVPIHKAQVRDGGGLVVGDADADGVGGGAAEVEGLGGEGPCAMTKGREQGEEEKEIFHSKTGFSIFAKITIQFS